jgi:hypoxanthine phosphoribosyltransferase
MIQIHDKSFEILLPKAEIEAKIKELAAQLNNELKEMQPLFIGVLNGSFMFAAELFKNLTIPAEITFLRVKSYTDTKSDGKVTEVLGLMENIEGRNVVILEDIVDTGLTVNKLQIILKAQKPKSIAIATLLFKPKAIIKPIKVDYHCFEIEPNFVVGYGLDYDGLGRNLSDVWVLKED